MCQHRPHPCAMGWAHHGMGTPWGISQPHPSPKDPLPCSFSSLPVASPGRFGLMLLRRYSSPWALDSVSSLLWPVTTISTTTATGELPQPWVPAGTGAAPGTAAAEPHPDSSCAPWPQAEHLSPILRMVLVCGARRGNRRGCRQPRQLNRGEN